jgi:O-antigen/teichoic acid export membrane protein
LFLLGIPFALTSFFHQLLPAIDRFFLIQYNFSQQMGPYILAVKLGSLINFAASAFILAFTPYSLAKLNEKEAENDIANLFTMVSIAGFCLVPFLLVFKDLLIDLFADASFSMAGNLLPFFFWGWLFDLFSYFSTLGIYRSQKSILSLVLFAVGFVVVSAFNLLLIPVYGLYGAAVSFCVSKTFLFFVSLIMLRKHFHLRIHYRSFCFTMLIGAVCSYLIYVLPLAVNLVILGLLLLTSVAYFKKQTFASFFKKI